MAPSKDTVDMWGNEHKVSRGNPSQVVHGQLHHQFAVSIDYQKMTLWLVRLKCIICLTAYKTQAQKIHRTGYLVTGSGYENVRHNLVISCHKSH